MAQLIYSERALADLGRLTDFLQQDPVTAVETIDLITEAMQILQNHPYIGRPAEEDLRELVISRGRSGYVALYCFEESLETVLVLSIRHQREAGYASE
ncbi:MAG TPA: type II toxin-antitoxin system RelE/ParE family toxin [Solimonas sp.]|nr:type II toxin-antitoxin system RelE/ParE family toxin [Solimonas sp.]